MSTIEIRKISITDLNTDAIVNAANDGLWAGGGVCGAIFKAAGYQQLQAACNKIGHCDTGSAVITPGFTLFTRWDPDGKTESTRNLSSFTGHITDRWNWLWRISAGRSAFR